MGSPTAVDEWTAWAITAIELSDEGEVSRWAGVLAAAAEDVTEWEPLSERIRTGAEQEFIDATVFLRTLGDSGQGFDLVRQLVALGDQLPGLYVALRERQGEPQDGVAAETSEFGWLHPDQETQLAGLWGDGWADYLRQQLDYRWGAGWQAHPDEHKAAWFGDVFAELAAPAEAQPADQLDAAFKSAVASVPGAADLTEEELAEVRAAVLAALQTTATGGDA